MKGLLISGSKLVIKGKFPVSDLFGCKIGEKYLHHANNKTNNSADNFYKTEFPGHNLIKRFFQFVR